MKLLVLVGSFLGLLVGICSAFLELPQEYAKAIYFAILGFLIAAYLIKQSLTARNNRQSIDFPAREWGDFD